MSIEQWRAVGLVDNAEHDALTMWGWRPDRKSAEEDLAHLRRIGPKCVDTYLEHRTITEPVRVD